MPDHLDAILDNTNAAATGPDLKDRTEVPREFVIGNRLSDLLEQAERLVPVTSLIAALRLMIRPNTPTDFTHPLLLDIQKTLRMLAGVTSEAVVVNRIQNRITRLSEQA